MFVAAGIAKWMAILATFPLIRAKYVQQAKRELSILGVVGYLAANETFFGLYKGLMATVSKTVIFTMVQILSKSFHFII